MPITELVERCHRNDPEAWQEMVQVLRRVVQPVMANTLWVWRFDRSLSEDVFQDFCLLLLQNDRRLLKTFRGRSQSNFDAFLRTIARRFTLRTVRCWHERRCRSQSALQELRASDREGPTEEQIRIAREELEGIMLPRDVERLRAVSAAAANREDPKSHPARTVRHWRRCLVGSYGDEAGW